MSHNRMNDRRAISVEWRAGPTSPANIDHVLPSVTSESFKVGVKNADDGGPIDILIYDAIGDPWAESTPSAVAEILAANPTSAVNVRINSPGGLAFDGITMYNQLVAHEGDVTTTIEGIAASAASIIAMAGDTVRMAENGSLFIHRALAVAIGNAPVMADMAEFLEKLDGQIALTFAARTGLPESDVMDMLTGDVDGTILTAQEAMDEGFVDEVIKAKAGKKKTKDAREAAQNMLATERAAKQKRAVQTRLRVMELHAAEHDLT